MEQIMWDPALETGDPTVDSQHKELFSLINQLRAAALEGWAEEGVRDVLDRLTAYVATHFTAEQEFMARIGYPAEKTEAHIEAHRALTERTHEMAEAYARGEATTVLPLAEFLYEWLRSHILRTDKALVDHARAAGEQV